MGLANLYKPEMAMCDSNQHLQLVATASAMPTRASRTPNLLRALGMLDETSHMPVFRPFCGVGWQTSPNRWPLKRGLPKSPGSQSKTPKCQRPSFENLRGGQQPNPKRKTRDEARASYPSDSWRRCARFRHCVEVAKIASHQPSWNGGNLGGTTRVRSGSCPLKI